MKAPRVRHRETGAEGDAVALSRTLSPHDGQEGPWLRVDFDDGLQCWCPVSQLETRTVLGWVPADTIYDG